MTLVNVMAAVMWLGVTCYALFGGADFGAGFWDLVAGSAKGGAKQRKLIEHSIGPIWEANHVWLIFVLVTMWTCFPVLFGSVTSTLWIPFMLAAFGIIARGSAFAFRKNVTKLWQKQLFGAAFAFSSIVTPFFFGAIAGAVATGKVPVGVGLGNPITSWVNPVSIMTGILAVVTCTYLAAVYLTADARRHGDDELVARFRRKALESGILAGIVASVGLLFLHKDVPLLAHGLAHRGLPLVILSGVAGVITLVLLYIGRFVAARITGALAVGAILWGWAAAQYPYLLPHSLTVAGAAAVHATLIATFVTACIGTVLILPSLVYLYVLFQRQSRS